MLSYKFRYIFFVHGQQSHVRYDWKSYFVYLQQVCHNDWHRYVITDWIFRPIIIDEQSILLNHLNHIPVAGMHNHFLKVNLFKRNAVDKFYFFNSGWGFLQTFLAQLLIISIFFNHPKYGSKFSFKKFVWVEFVPDPPMNKRVGNTVYKFKLCS